VRRRGGARAPQCDRASAHRRRARASDRCGARGELRAADRGRGGDPRRGGVANALRSPVGGGRPARNRHRSSRRVARNGAGGGGAAPRRADAGRAAAPAGRRGDRERRDSRRARDRGREGMADARWSVIAVVCAVAARAAAIGPPCEEERGRNGLALTATEQGLTVGGVDEESAAAAAGLGGGDTVVQVNGTVARACADYGRTVHEAERERKAVLLLVRRGDSELPLVLGGRTWDRPLPVVPPPPKTEAPTVRAMVEKPPPPLPAEAHVTLDELLQGFAALVPPDRPPARLATYQHDLLKLHRQTEALAARAAVPAEVAAG